MNSTIRPIRILHFCEHFGGKESSLHGVAKAFQWWFPLFDSQQFEVFLCSRKGRDKAFEQMEESGLSPYTLGYHKIDLRNYFALKNLVKDKRIQIIHAHGFGACMWARFVGKSLGIPVIVHGRANYGRVPLSIYPIEKWLGPGTKYGIAVSESTKQFMIQKRFIAEKAVQVIYNGILLDKIKTIDTSQIAVLKKSLEIKNDEFVLGIVGRLVGHKGHRDVFKAMARLDSKILHKTRLLVIGDGDFRLELEKKAIELGIMSQITFLGFRNDVIDLIQCLDVQIFPSYLEGTPNTLYEAMAVGCAIIASPTDGQGEILEHNKTALMYDLGNIELLAKSIEQLFTDQNLRSQLKLASKKRSLDFEGKKCIEAIQKLYRRVVNENNI